MPQLVGVVVGVPHTQLPGFGDLPGIHNDVAVFEELLRHASVCTSFVGSEATVDAVHGAIVSWHERLVPGDTFVLAFSGHGAQRPRPGSPEWDKKAESLVLVDGHYGDVNLRSALHGFQRGVRVIALIDACHGAGSTYIRPPEPAERPLVHRRGARVPGATSLTLAAASESDDANQVLIGREHFGQLAECLRRAWKYGEFTGSWLALWNETSQWWLGLGYEPTPEAWLDGPDDDASILDAPAFRP